MKSASGQKSKLHWGTIIIIWVIVPEMNILQEFASLFILQTNLEAGVPLLGHQRNLFQQILKSLLSSMWNILYYFSSQVGHAVLPAWKRSGAMRLSVIGTMAGRTHGPLRMDFQILTDLQDSPLQQWSGKKGFVFTGMCHHADKFRIGC